MRVTARPLTAEAFAPFGDVLEAPPAPGRAYFDGGLGNLRPEARPSFSMASRDPFDGASIDVKELERHEFSSQTFLAIEAARWLIVVCPHAADGGPDASRALAFIASGGQGVTYRPDTWHHSLTVLDRPARFAVFMWRDGSTGDEQFVPVTPFTIDLPA
jgi:ureidoglycolate lyase